MSSIKLVQEELAAQIKNGLLTPEQAVEKMQASLVSKRTYLPPSINDLKQRFATNQELRRRAVNSKIPFIDSGVGNDFKLTQGLILIGGVSGQGKSTTSANLLNGYLESDNKKKALVITNEENMGAVYTRTACARLGLNFKDYYNSRLSNSSQQDVEDCVEEMMGRVVVEDGSEAYDMTVLEDMQAALIHAADGDYGIALVDYFQTVTTSSEDESLDPVRVSKKLGFFMKDFGRKVGIPVIMFVQLRDSNELHFKDRVENDRTVYNHAFMAIEIVPDFENRTSKFVFHKDRFGDAQGKEIEMVYRGGKFEPMGSL